MVPVRRDVVCPSQNRWREHTSRGHVRAPNTLGLTASFFLGRTGRSGDLAVGFARSDGSPVPSVVATMWRGGGGTSAVPPTLSCSPPGGGTPCRTMRRAIQHSLSFRRKCSTENAKVSAGKKSKVFFPRGKSVNRHIERFFRPLLKMVPNAVPELGP